MDMFTGRAPPSSEQWCFTGLFFFGQRHRSDSPVSSRCRSGVFGEGGDGGLGLVSLLNHDRKSGLCLRSKAHSHGISHGMGNVCGLLEGSVAPHPSTDSHITPSLVEPGMPVHSNEPPVIR